jgi:hypothetical protein
MTAFPVVAWCPRLLVFRHLFLGWVFLRGFLSNCTVQLRFHVLSDGAGMGWDGAKTVYLSWLASWG